MRRIALLLFVCVLSAAANPLPAEEMIPGATVEGRVFDAESGEPLADALVSLYQLPAMPADPEDYRAWNQDDTTVIENAATDEDGYFSFQVPWGFYQLYYSARNHAIEYSAPFELAVKEVRSVEVALPFQEEAVARKPNLYLYPPEAMEVDIALAFPAGGRVTESDPPYAGGWSAVVQPDGSFGSGYDYFFYEAEVPDDWQRDEGWLVEKGNLEAFLRQNLAEYGFRGREIEDFIDYWLPRLEELSEPQFLIYPQLNARLDPLIELKIDPAPDSFLRLLYVIENVDPLFALVSPPVIPEFRRGGFTAVEWGVVLDNVSGRQVE